MSDFQNEVEPRVFLVQQRVRKRTGTDNVVKEEWGDIALTWRDFDSQMVVTTDMSGKTHVLHTWSKGDIKQLVHEPGNKVFAVVVASAEVYVFRSKTLHQRETIVQYFQRLIQEENKESTPSNEDLNDVIRMPLADGERFPYHGTVHLSHISDVKTAGKFNKVYRLSESTVRVDRR